tara:strand:+ start:48130 stop:48549 length:420 start_codon:yes stop_codon:yes gene_type:complete
MNLNIAVVILAVALLSRAHILTDSVAFVEMCAYNIQPSKPEQKMSKFDTKDVEKVAHLARLQLDDADVPGYAQSMTSILDLIEQMQAVDTKAVEPMAHPLDATQRLRADIVTETNEREKLQTLAPATEAGLYLVPQVIE